MLILFGLVFGSLFSLFYFYGWLFIYFLLVFITMMYLGLMDFEMLGMHLYYSGLGADSMGVGLILLTFWILLMMIYSSLKLFISNVGQYYLFFILVMGSFLFIMFMSLDFILFYISFEIVLLPIFFIVLGWGYQPERMSAGIYLIFYTLFGSLPLLVMILYYVGMWGEFNMIMYNLFGIMGIMKYLFYLLGVFTFLVKMPMFMVHLWLPKAHVEAPIAGSMVLAGILLKMGGYGILRIMKMFFNVSSYFSSFFISISLVGGIYLSLLCLCQSDMKALIAYSSVVHMGMVIAGSMTLFSSGFIGAYILMVGHGLCSSGMFCLANFSYERSGSRSLVMNKGFINILPIGALMWFLFCSSNMAAPPSLNLLGEILLIITLINWSLYVLFLLVFFSFFSACYSLYLFCSVQHGQTLYLTCSKKEYNLLEYLLLMMHWVPLNFLFLKSDIFI